MSDAGDPPPQPSYPPPGGYPPPGAGAPPPSPVPPAQPPAAPPPPYGGPPYGGVPVWTPPVLQPGAVPLRPLGLGDLYNGAFAVLRRNAGATLGASVLVSALAGLIPLLVSVLVGFSGETIDLEAESFDLTDAQLTRLLLLGGAFALGLLLDQVGQAIVTGMIAAVAVGAAQGRVFRMPEAWAATRGLRWRLIALPLLIGLVSALALGLYIGLWVAVIALSDGAALPVLFGLVSVPLAIAGTVLAFIRLTYVAVPALVIERIGVWAAFGRAARLSRGSFWRLFGISLLTAILVGIAGGIIGAPVSFGAQILASTSPEYAIAILIIGQVLGSILSSATTTPFSSVVVSLQYLDLRIRNEGYDVELLAGAVGTAPAGGGVAAGPGTV